MRLNVALHIHACVRCVCMHKWFHDTAWNARTYTKFPIAHYFLVWAIERERGTEDCSESQHLRGIMREKKYEWLRTSEKKKKSKIESVTRHDDQILLFILEISFPLITLSAFILSVLHCGRGSFGFHMRFSSIYNFVLVDLIFRCIFAAAAAAAVFFFSLSS